MTIFIQKRCRTFNSHQTRHTRWRMVKLLAIALLMIAVAGCSQVAMAPYLVSSPASTNDLFAQRRGMLLFDAHCARCHGPQGRGDGAEAIILKTKPTDLRIAAREKSERVLVAIIAIGKGEEMPAFKKLLSDQQMWEIAYWLKSL